MTPYQSHAERWKDCRLCELCSQRSRVVLFRGQVPCDVLFVGEAPGMSEDALGQPFKGPAGRLLDHIVETAWAALTDCQVPGPRVGFTNLVGCFPRDNKQTENHAPPEGAIKTCSKRLAELVKLCRPKLAVCVGKLSSSWVQKQRASLGLGDVPLVHVEHPAFILRSNQAVQGLMVKKCVVTILSAVRGLSLS